jgi:competence protein ComEC
MPALGIYALVGVLAGLWIRTPAPALVVTVLVVAAAAIWWLAGAAPALAVGAFAIASFHCHWYLDSLLPEQLNNQNVLIQGRVANFPSRGPDAIRFLFRTTPESRLEGLPELLRLTLYQPEFTPLAGEKWRLLVRLKRPQGLTNPGIRDQSLDLMRLNVHATGYVRSSALNRRLDAQTIGSVGLTLRALLASRLEAAAETLPGYSFLAGITLGIRNQLTEADWELLRRTGTSHLLAISGLHIGMVALAMWQVGFWAGWLAARLVPAVSCLRWARCLSLASALSYAMLAGFSITTVRACCMVVLVIGLTSRNRGWQAIRVLAGALLFAILVNPFSVLSAGFWLSFLAVALLFTCVAKQAAPLTSVSNPSSDAALRVSLPQWIRMTMRAKGFSWLQAQWVISLGLALPSLLFFNTLSLIAPLANLIAIPAFSVTVLPASLLGLLLAAGWTAAGTPVLYIADAGLAGLLAFLQLLASLPVSFSPTPSLTASQLALIATGIGCLLMPRPLPVRWLSVPLILSGCLWTADPEPEKLELYVLDVGQGLAVLVRTGGKTLLYDTGPGWQSSDAGKHIVVPVLHHLGIHKLDVLVISHWDKDHSGGLNSILDVLAVGRLMAPVAPEWRMPVRENCRRGMRWQWGKVSFEFLHPSKPEGWSDNNASCVLLIQVGRHRILLPGDIEAPVEPLVLRHTPAGQMDIILAPHHGSRSSSGSQFVAGTRPTYTIFSAAYSNRWGFPAAEVEARWQNAGACTAATAHTGAILFSLQTDTVMAEPFYAKASLMRPWLLRLPSKALCKQHSRAL